MSQDVDGTTTHYVVDDNNVTGYAQVLEEKQDTNGDGTIQDDEVTKSYVVGHDVIAQAAAAAEAMFLAYDGHGSTRALLDEVGQIILDGAQKQLFSFDAYGNLIIATGLVQQVQAALTTLLYSGEQTDAATGLQYLRARYYSSLTGTFNRVDPFSGNLEDPQSLHKYLYTHGDPVNGIDPTGFVNVEDNRRHVVEIRISPKGMPRNFNEELVEAQLQSMLSEVGILVSLTIGNQFSASELGMSHHVTTWSSQLEGWQRINYLNPILWFHDGLALGTSTPIGYNHSAKFVVRPYSAQQPQAHTASGRSLTEIFPNGIEQGLLSTSGKVDYNVLYANILLHEVFYIGVLGNTDDIAEGGTAGTPFENSKSHIRTPTELTAGEIEMLQKRFSGHIFGF